MTVKAYPPFAALPVGATLDWPGPVVPPLWLQSYGQSLIRDDYHALFLALIEHKGSCLISNSGAGLGCVITKVGHGLVVGDPVYFFVSSGGSLPTGITANTTYFVQGVVDADNFSIGTTRAFNIITGAVTVTVSVSTTSAGSGTFNLVYAPYEVADSTHFYVPDYRGNVVVTKDNMGGTDAGRIAWANVLGLRAGEGTHTLLTTESGQKAVSTGDDTPDHVHSAGGGTAFVVQTGGGGFIGAGGVYNVQSNTGGRTTFHQHPITGSDAANAHNTMQPGIVQRKIIYAGV